MGNEEITKAINNAIHTPVDGSVVYGLVSKSGDIVYVGQSCKPLSRLKQHRKKHGQEIDMAILQQSFENESAREAEEKWIKKFSAGGAELTNIVHAREDRKPVMLRIKKGMLERIDKGAERLSLARTGFILSAVAEKLERMEG